MTSMRLRITAASLLLALTALSVPAAGAAERWTRLGPFGGRVLEVVVAPLSPRTLYAVTDAGVYRSDNAGARWVPAWRGLGPWVSTLAVHPVEESVAYAGINGFVEPGDPTVYKTVDGGATWQPTGLTLEPAEDIAVDPYQPATILVASRNDVFRSTDGGATWTSVLRPASIADFENVAFDPSASGVAYAASNNQGLFKSVDHGATWTPKSDRLPGGDLSRLGVSPAGVLYAQSNGGILRSTDGGETWKRAGSIPADAFVRSFAFAADHTSVFAGTDQGIYRNDGQSSTWTPLRPGLFEDVASVATDPADFETVYAGVGQFGPGFRGVLKSTDDGETWRPVNRGLGGEPVTAIAIAPSAPRVIYALAAGLVVRSADGGATWRPMQPSGDPTVGNQIVELQVHPRDPDMVYAAARYGGFWRTTDGGATWTGEVIDDGECVWPSSLVLDPRNPRRLFVTGGQETACQRGGETSCLTLGTTDGGASWTCLREEGFLSLVLDPRRPDNLYASGGDGDLQGVFKSTDGGETWALSWDSRPGIPFPLAVSSRGTLWAASELELVRSRNSGQTWRPFERGLPPQAVVRHIVVSPSNPSVVYVSTVTFDDEGSGGFDDSGLYVSTNNGASWRPLSEPRLPPLSFLLTPYLTLEVDPRDPGRLYVGTPFGLYRLDGAL